MSKEVREEKQREIRIKIGDFKALQQKYMEDFKALENQNHQPNPKRSGGAGSGYRKKRRLYADC